MFTAAGAGLFLDMSDAKSSPSELMGGVDDFLGFAQAYVLGGVDFAADEGERREYYRKMIDMNGTSRAQIERIFSDVSAADRTFASEMNTWTSDARSCLHSLNEIAGKVHG
ncbi:hypothetical protein [Propioniciclava tarda]|uniref:Uncharacterized protein n=1 Tax=Propioniciclava tarda TaxID=433330 RepID=A0A4Q9KMM1_PROTD|nr:hypothetical protein [Propioniciclava tarda]TBT95475.1 hypothetical protein ET996_05095 [Propioniciclava tarda]SMO49880.1 hypothetical protein SAMN06266982_10478 [Propioniciclava tarda]